jgi:hypothetical protein
MKEALGAGGHGLLEQHDALIGLVADELQGGEAAGRHHVEMLPAARGHDKSFGCGHFGPPLWRNEDDRHQPGPPNVDDRRGLVNVGENPSYVLFGLRTTGRVPNGLPGSIRCHWSGSAAVRAGIVCRRKL